MQKGIERFRSLRSLGERARKMCRGESITEVGTCTVEQVPGHSENKLGPSVRQSVLLPHGQLIARFIAKSHSASSQLVSPHSAIKRYHNPEPRHTPSCLISSRHSCSREEVPATERNLLCYVVLCCIVPLCYKDNRHYVVFHCAIRTTVIMLCSTVP
jgi:hypothetical protein